MTQENRRKLNVTTPRKIPDNRCRYTPLEESLLNNFQQGFPLTQNPFETIANKLDTDTATVINTLKKLKMSGAIAACLPRWQFRKTRLAESLI